MRIMHYMMDFYFRLLNFIVEKLKLDKKRKKMLEVAKKDETCLYRYWYLDNFDPDLEQSDEHLTALQNLTKNHPESSAKIIKFWIMEDLTPEQRHKMNVLTANLQEFHLFNMSYQLIKISGIDKARQLLEKILGKQKTQKIISSFKIY